jgi:acyl-CoA thioesterase-2
VLEEAIDPVSFATMMALEDHGPDTFVGVGPRYPWGGLYGGQIVAQALRAACLTVEAHHPHSLHAYFIRRGDASEPIRFEVDRLRNGRSFSTRRVVARQAGGAILSLEASFHAGEEAPDEQLGVMPDVAGPDDSYADRWSHLFERRWPSGERTESRGSVQAWLRLDEAVAADPSLQACAFAYLSDDLPTDAVVQLHPERRRVDNDFSFDETFMSASLDHSIWFHRPFSVNEWQLHELHCKSYTANRGITSGEVYDSAGRHLATISQEVLLRAVKGQAGAG